MILNSICSAVLVPYKITLLSNNQAIGNKEIEVLVPYKITLLSNLTRLSSQVSAVLVPYKITLLSNTRTPVQKNRRSFSTL